METKLQSSTGKTTIWLAKDIQTQIFVDTRIAGLIAGAARRGPVDIVDWGADGSRNRSIERLSSSPEGVAAALFSNEILLESGVPIPDTKDTVIQNIIAFGGQAEPKPAEGTIGSSRKTLTIYAFDDRDPRPIALSKSDDYFSFKSNFEKSRRAYFEHGLGENYSQKMAISTNDAVSRFIFEIFQNAFRHGRRSARQDIIVPAMRYIRMKKHIGSSSNFSKRAAGFSELETYLGKIKPSANQLSFVEVSIIDNGIGIVNRFLSTNPKYRDSTSDPDFKHRLINLIVAKALSSNAEHSGAGNGLRNALRAVSEVRGFVSIRSGDSWVYYSGQDKLNLEFPFQRKSASTTISPICGTQVCMLYPLSYS
jgi:hypothetical protein